MTVSFMLVSPVFSQESKVDQAINAFVANDLSTAKAAIDEAASDPSQNSNYQTWYWKGLIYKELYKTMDKGKTTDSKNRLEAVEAYKTAMKDKSKVSSDTMQSIVKSLKFLGSTFYNDAVVQLDTVNYETAVKNYAMYSDVTTTINPEASLIDQHVKFKMKLAMIYVSLYDAHARDESGKVYFEAAKAEYSKIIELKKTHLSANYNLGILFYNRAVNIIQSMDYGIDLEALSKKEEQCVALFLQALPYMKTAYDIDPTRKETLISLKGIYYSLNDQDQYDRYKKELEQLK